MRNAVRTPHAGDHASIRSSPRVLVSASARARLILASLVVASANGCGSAWHNSTLVTLDVVDALTGAPAPDIVVLQQVAVDKFERPLWERATSNRDGVAAMRAIGNVPQSYWSVGVHGPTYDGVGRSQLPTEFRRVASDEAAARFIAPVWPAMWIRIELAADHRGLVFEWPLALDDPRTSGWMPPAAVPLNAERVATAHASDDGVVAYPASFGGLAGFEFRPERMLVRGERPLATIGCNRRHPKLEPNAVVAWEMGYADADGAPITSPQGRGAVPSRPHVWFVGTEDDLRAWLGAQSISPITPGPYGDATDLAEWRIFVRSDLFGQRTAPAAPTTPPVWSVRVDR